MAAHIHSHIRLLGMKCRFIDVLVPISVMFLCFTSAAAGASGFIHSPLEISCLLCFHDLYCQIIQ